MKLILGLVAILFLNIVSFGYAEDDKIAFAGYLEKTLGHFWAIEKNLDDNNANLAIVHATHPISELYLSMKPELKKANPEFDAQVQKTLMELHSKVGDKVTRKDAQKSIDEAKRIIEQARSIVIGDKLSKDTNFNVAVMINLLAASKAEYAEGVKNGKIAEMIEFQDGSSFVWRSQQIFEKIKPDLPKTQAEKIGKLYPQVWKAYDSNVEPSEVARLVDSITHELDEVSSTKTESANLGTYFDNIQKLLADAKKQYAAGKPDVAQSLVTKAYLDNYEYLEPILLKQNPVLKKEIELMMRQDLRTMLKTGESKDKVGTQIDAILKKLEQAKKLVMSEQKPNSEKYTTSSKYDAQSKDVNCAKPMQLLSNKETGKTNCVKSESVAKMLKSGWTK